MPVLKPSYDDLDRAAWRDRALKAEAEVERLREALRDITVRQNALAQAEAEVARLRERFISHLVHIDGFSREAAELMVDKDR